MPHGALPTACDCRSSATVIANSASGPASPDADEALPIVVRDYIHQRDVLGEPLTAANIVDPLARPPYPAAQAQRVRLDAGCNVMAPSLAGEAGTAAIASTPKRPEEASQW